MGPFVMGADFCEYSMSASGIQFEFAWNIRDDIMSNTSWAHSSYREP